MASIYKRGDTWWIAYRIGGKNICHSLDTNNARVAEEQKLQYEALKVNGLIPLPSNTPIAPFMAALCEYWRMTKTPKSAENDIGRLRGIFGPCCDAMKLRPHTPHAFKNQQYDTITAEDVRTGRYLPVRRLEDLTPQAINRYLQHRMVRDHLGGKTINHIRGILSAMFTYARKFHGYRCPHPDYKNPIEGVDRFPETLGPILYLKPDDITAQLDALADQPDLRAMAATYIYAGLRRSEGLWLNKEDVDLERLVIRVVPKAEEGDSWKPKTGKSRSVAISRKLAEELRTYLPHQKDGTWFFASPDGKRWHPDNFSKHLRLLNDEKGLPWSCDEYRHTFGSLLAQKGLSLFEISALMGNSPDICRKHYAALLPQEMHAKVDF